MTLISLLFVRFFTALKRLPLAPFTANNTRASNELNPVMTQQFEGSQVEMIYLFSLFIVHFPCSTYDLYRYRYH